MTHDRAALRARIQQRLLAQPPSPEDRGAGRRVAVLRDVSAHLAREAPDLSRAERASIERELTDAIAGLGPLEPLLRDPAITEIMVNDPENVFVERRGRLERLDIDLRGAEGVLHLIDRVVGPLGLRVDAARPWVDARLPDGSRVHAIVPPLAVAGPALTIRKFARVPVSPDDLVRTGSLTPEMLGFLASCVRARINLIVCGGAGAGKTTLLNVLSGFIPAGERIVTIEDAAELRLRQPNVVALETRSANIEGAGAIDMRDLVRNALRMRPDRIVVGEVRGGEATDMLQAMNTGHNGSMSTVHANSSFDLVSRLEAMVLMADVALPLASVRSQIAAGVDLVVHVVRDGDRRRVSEIASIRGIRGGVVCVEPLVALEGGEHRSTGALPRFLPRLRDAGEPPPPFASGRSR